MDAFFFLTTTVAQPDREYRAPHRTHRFSYRFVASDLRGSSVGFPEQEVLPRGPGHEHAHVGTPHDDPVSPVPRRPNRC